MTDPLQLRATDTGLPVARPAAATRSGKRAAAPRGGRIIVVLLAVIVLGAAGAWTYVARRELSRSLVTESAQHLAYARKGYETMRDRSRANLQAQCRVLVEDPRLKSTLAIEGIDTATVDDILKDLSKLRGGGFLVVLSPDGRVFAQAGAAELRGLDLSGSSVVQQAQASKEAITGSWVLAGKVMDLSIMAIRYGENLIAYLVVGQAVDEQLLTTVAEQSGVEIASALAATIGVASTKDEAIHRVFASVSTSGASAGRIVTVENTRYVTGVVELTETTQAHRLILVRRLGDVTPTFERLDWMLFAPPVLVLFVVLFLLTGTRSPRRI